MTRKSLGYVELEWTCKRCGTVNPGMQKTCTNCGAPMAESDQFELPEEQKLIEDEAKLAAAKKGPDIVCPYCGAPNPAGSESCSQCSGDLREGAVREAGKVLGAHTTAPAATVACPFCQAQISPNLPRCPNCGGDLAPKAAKPTAAPVAPARIPRWMLIAGAALLLLCCGGAAVFGLMNMRTQDVRAQVQDVSWQRTIDILEQQLVRDSNWEENVPTDAQDVSCADKYRETRSNPAPNSTEVCGTPYTVDQGGGAGEVVQDCQYEVYASFCEYQVYQWVVVTKASADGRDLQPYWPNLSLAAGQREGDRAEVYQVVFSADGQAYTYQLNDETTFSQFTPGSEWTLKVNSFGSINAVEP